MDIINLKVRKIDFQFDEDISFYWNPKNPHMGNLVNYITLIAPAFEKYFIKATRDAMPDIKNPAVAKEADLFCKQEAQHSKYHLAHLKVLTRQHPGLEKLFEKINQSYENLYQNEDVNFHLGYAAVIELCFGPIAKFIVANRACLFSGSNVQIASFILWHFVEEFEHRNSAYNVFNDVVGSYRCRLKSVKAVVQHLIEIDKMTREGLNECVPMSSYGVLPGDVNRFSDQIPKMSKVKLVYELLCTLLPYHKPNNMQQPDWVTQWFKDEAAGVDMRTYYP